MHVAGREVQWPLRYHTPKSGGNVVYAYRNLSIYAHTHTHSLTRTLKHAHAYTETNIIIIKYCAIHPLPHYIAQVPTPA